MWLAINKQHVRTRMLQSSQTQQWRLPTQPQGPIYRTDQHLTIPSLVHCRKSTKHGCIRKISLFTVTLTCGSDLQHCSSKAEHVPIAGIHWTGHSLSGRGVAAGSAQVCLWSSQRRILVPVFERMVMHQWIIALVHTTMNVKYRASMIAHAWCQH